MSTHVQRWERAWGAPGGPPRGRGCSGGVRSRVGDEAAGSVSWRQAARSRLPTV